MFSLHLGLGREGLKRLNNKNYLGIMSSSHVLQVDVRIPLAKDFFPIKLAQVFFPPFFEYHILFQDQSEENIGEDDVIDMIEIIVL